MTRATITLADLIDQYEASRDALHEARLRTARAKNAVRLALSGHPRGVAHKDLHWAVDEGHLGSFRLPFPGGEALPNARDVEVPAECLGEIAEASPDQP